MPSPRWTAADLPDLSGRTAVVTGASSGIGLVTGRELARVGARVILAVRDTGKGRQAAATMPGRTEVRSLDVASLASIRVFADGWDGGLDIRVHLDDLNGDHRGYNALRAYRDSKIATILFTAELQRRLSESHSQVRAMTAHPGIARTSLNDHVGGLGGWLSARLTTIFNDADHGAYPTLYAATMDIPSGSYVGPDGLGHLRGYPEVRRPGRAARGNSDLARQLWEVSTRLTGTSFPAYAI